MAFGDARYVGTVRAVRKLAKRYRCDCVWNALHFVEISQFDHISNGARTTRLLNFNLISRAELSNGDVEASSASRSDRHLRCVSRLGAVSLTENGYVA